uniref:Uncharacterized protein n=1 Tax=viral metagenome TaxID=1070528 RepID=A0A6M3JDK9_9ZZZZ
MALKNTWYAAYGPYPYEDTAQYPDAAPLEGGRTPQAYIENSATQYYHVTRKSELDSVATSLVTGTADSVARSMATSGVALAGSQDTSQGVRLSVIESKLVSGGW